MGAILAAIIIFLVLGASMGLLFTHLEQVDEYNRQVSKLSEKQQNAVQENIKMSAVLTGENTYDINITNTRALSTEIIEIRSMTSDGRVTSINGENNMKLASFADDTLHYTIPDDVDGDISILAITSMGNTFSVKIESSGILSSNVVNAASATVNGMGLSSRLAQIEYSGHTIFGSDLQGDEESLKPYTTISTENYSNPLEFAAVILDSDNEQSWKITDYDHDVIINVNSDGTVNRTTKPNILTYTKVRGDATISSDSSGIAVSSNSKTESLILKLDPKFFGKTLLFDANVGNGKIEILTSPYGNLADNITIQHVKDRCNGIIWNNHLALPWRSENLVPKFVYTANWSFDPTSLDAFLIHAQSIPIAPESTKSTSTYDKSVVSESRHLHDLYWHAIHHQIPHGSSSLHRTGTVDHGYTSGMFTDRYRYHAHPGNYEITYDTSTINFDAQDLLLRNNSKFYVSYAPMANLKINALQQSEETTHAEHRLNDDTAIQLFKKLYYRAFNNVFFAIRLVESPPFATAYTNLEPKFQTAYTQTYEYQSPDYLFGIPIVLYNEGTNGNADYASLNSVTINGIDHQDYTRRYHNNLDDMANGRDLCVFAETPYKIHEIITSDIQHHKIVLPDRVDPYAQHLYIKINPNNSQITLKAVGIESIMGIDADTPYRILNNSKTIHAGLSSSNGTIDHYETFPESFTLSLYPESMLYRGSFSTIVFDPHSEESFRLSTPDERIYTVHTWVQIPVVGSVIVSDVKVLTKQGSEIQLEYLDGTYTASSDDSGRIWIPVLPGYYSIHMKINNVDAALRYSDVLGASNVKIISPSTNTVSKESTSPITTIRASSGSVAYAISTSDGNMAAIVQGTVSGTAYFDHKYTEFNIVTPCSYDPLSGWIQIYKNGDLFRSGYKFVNYEPHISINNYVDSGGFRHVKTTFTYNKQHIQETISIPVQTGDFVEFFIHSNIFAENALPSFSNTQQCGINRIILHHSTQASATANIHDGSIIIG